MESYIVYVKTNGNSYIISITSSAFLPDATGWTQIDSGYGDKYHHAQGNYFPQPIITEGGAYRYKLVDDKIVECTDEEITQQEEALKSVPSPTLETRVETLEGNTTEMAEALNMILSGVTE